MSPETIKTFYKNIKAEAEAIEEYTELLAMLDGEVKRAVEEIVSDENNIC